MSEYTPGPWYAKLLEADGRVIERNGWEIRTPNWDVATWTGRCGPIRKEADAHLIAAAPEMYEVLEFWLGAVQNSLALRLALTSLPEGAGPALIEMLQEAIEKAEGE